MTIQRGFHRIFSAAVCSRAFEPEIITVIIVGMSTYLLRDIDPTLWQRVKVRAVTEGRSLRGLILWLLAKYADGKVR